MKFGSLGHCLRKHIIDFLRFEDKIGNADTVVISTQGLIKKRDKTPQMELDKAERLRKLYLKQKTKKK